MAKITKRQKEIAEAVCKHGSQAKAAAALGISKGTVGKTMFRMQQEQVSGRSTLRDGEGTTILEWVKTSNARQSAVAAVREAIEEFKADIKPCKPVPLKRKNLEKDLLNLYILTDAHIGMKAWGEETGADWDLGIAEQTIDSAFNHLIDRSPAAETGFFCQLGDGLHYDGMAAVTPASGHLLDADGRFQKVVRTAIRVFRRNIDALLTKHKKVVVLFAAGNHDPASSAWLQETFSLLYAGNPRVTVIVSPLPYYAFEHGRSMLAFHHGHKSRTNKVHHTLMGEFRGMMGRTEQTFVHTGHLHSSAVIEFPGAIIEQHPTLAGRDSYSSHGGWHSLRRMSAITYHRDFFEVERHQFYPTRHPLT